VLLYVLVDGQVLSLIPMRKYPDEDSTGAELARFTLERQPKYEVKEVRAREILQTLGLPQYRVKTVKYKGSRTGYVLIDSLSGSTNPVTHTNVSVDNTG